MSHDLLLYTDENIEAQIASTPLTFGFFLLRFYTEGGKPVNRVTPSIGEFYLYPSGGTLRDSSFNLLWYDSRFDTYRGFRWPKGGGTRP
jgi:hypothetical protein